MKIIKLILFYFFISLRISAQPFEPVNKNASPEVRKILKYLYSMQGKKILSGQHDYIDKPDRYKDSVYDFTGKYPALWGTDFIWTHRLEQKQAIVDEAIKKHIKGYLVNLMWHQGRMIEEDPNIGTGIHGDSVYDLWKSKNWSTSIQGELDDAQWKELITPGTNLHKKWLDEIDLVASYLKQLQNAKVPILWRPYHEMNGAWFWWGDKKGKDGFVKLWKLMYERYTNYHKLNNLIWVWGPNARRDIPGDEAYAYKDYYPGHQYVDILGVDVYNSDFEQKDYNELLGLAQKRIIALTEVGTLPSDKVLKAQPMWSWFYVWAGWLLTHNSKDRIKQIYKNEETLTLDELNIPK